MSMLDAIKRDGPVNLVGDAKNDSPGHSAKYCTYTMMTDERKVAAFNVVQVTEVTSSNTMEKEGFESCIQDLAQERLTIKRIATDRSSIFFSQLQFFCTTEASEVIYGGPFTT